MKRGCGGAHHDGAMLKRDFIRQFEYAAPGHEDEFRVTAIPVLADHLAAGAELLVVLRTPRARAASGEIVDANAVAGFELFHVAANGFYNACNFMAEC